MNAGDLHHVIDGAVDDDTDTGGGAIVLVHGSWTDHATWQFVRPLLAEHHVVVAYDRRGHSHSGPSDEDTTQAHGTRRPVDHATLLARSHDIAPAVSTNGIPARGAIRSSNTHRRPPRRRRRRNN